MLAVSSPFCILELSELTRVEKAVKKHNYNCNIQGVSVHTNVSANYRNPSSTTIYLQRPPDTSYKEHTAIRADRCDTQPLDQTMQEHRASQNPH